MTVAPETSTVKRALSAHAAIGLLAGALLYIVCLSGTLLVFYEEWQRFEQPSPPQMTEIDSASISIPRMPTMVIPTRPCATGMLSV